LSASAAAATGVAVAGAGSLWPAPPSGQSSIGGLKGGGRALISEPVRARDLGGALPFALARFAEVPSMIAASKRARDSLASPGAADRVLSPLRDVSFRGFATGAGSLEADTLNIVAVHLGADGATYRHDLWSHSPALIGGTSQSILFTAHDEAFAGFEVTHVAAGTGKRSSAFFDFMASGSGPQLKPGVYVLAGPRAATNAPPDLGDHAFSGDVRMPVRPSQITGLDFAYLSFAVYGEWI